MKKTLNLLIALVIMAFFASSSSYAYSDNVASFKDIQNHWAKNEIIIAAKEGWINGYEDQSFRPQGHVTRAEFVKMIGAAFNLNPDSETSKFLLNATEEYRAKNKLYGVDTHWISKQSWIEPALAYGVIIPSDYTNNNFEPNKEISRREIVVILNRIMGLLEAARDGQDAKLPFVDADKISPWLKGYVKQAVDNGLITGFPDGTFRSNENATRAEAVVMIKRTMNKIDVQSNSDIKVYVNGSFVDLPVPVIFVNDVPFVPVRSIIQAAADTDTRMTWDPVKQKLLYTWVMTHEFQPNKDNYVLNGGLYFSDFPEKSRMYNGELMVPVFGSNNPSYLYNLWKAEWNEENKTLNINVITPLAPNPS